jgi:hypothetical protein
MNHEVVLARERFFTGISSGKNGTNCLLEFSDSTGPFRGKRFTEDFASSPAFLAG